jgi:diaminopimelate decarboxylase
MGVFRRLARQAVAHAIDYVHERRGRHGSRPSSAVWGIDVNAAGNLSLHGHDLVDIARQYGTPLHVVDRERLKRNYDRFYGAFASRYPSVAIGYSYKTNPLPGAIRVLHECGAYAEVISHFELWLALQLGVPPERIIFNGPGKSLASLELAVSRGIFMINIDGPGEVEAIAQLAARYDKRQRVALRVVTSVGWSAQFGSSIGTGAALAMARSVVAQPRLELRGLHVHLGTGISDIRTYLQAIGEVLEFGNTIRSACGIDLAVFDFGGGFGVPTVRKFTGVDQLLLDHSLPPVLPALEDSDAADGYAAAIVPVVKRYVQGRNGPPPMIIFEPGRAITSSAQFLLLKVLAVKPSQRPDRATVIMDGGRNIVMPPSWEHHGLLHGSKEKQPGTVLYDVYGPLCHPGDLLFRGRSLPELATDDVLAIMDAGAYFIPNQMNFSNPRPAAVLVSKSGVELIRERERFEHIVQLDGVVSRA